METMRFLEEELVALNVTVTSAEAAIREAGKLLHQASLVEERYIDAMIASFHSNGPYIVLAPQIAIPHARPEDGVKEACVSLLKLAEPIRFGHSTNDPVKLVFALGASSSEAHLALLQKLVTLLMDPQNVERLEIAKNYQEVKNIIGGE